MTDFDPTRIHQTHNVTAAFGGTLRVVDHCHHCVGGNCRGTCLIKRVQGPVDCVHSGIPTSDAA